MNSFPDERLVMIGDDDAKITEHSINAMATFLCNRPNDYTANDVLIGKIISKIVDGEREDELCGLDSETSQIIIDNLSAINRLIKNFY